MTTSARRDSRRDYRHFPAAYTELLERVRAEGKAALGPMPLRDAQAGARDLYRFKMFLTNGVDDDPDDAHCRHLLNIARDCTIRVEPVACLPGDDPVGDTLTHLISISLNPIVAAMAAQGGRQ